MHKILTFQEALDKSQGRPRHLILGNGFSIACRPKIFTYGSLFKQADFSKHKNLPKVFSALGTQDFEQAIKALEQASKVNSIYNPEGPYAEARMLEDAKELKKILIKTVTQNHPDRPDDLSDEEYKNCRLFLNNFIGTEGNGKIFTLNYDLLLYWVLMHRDRDAPDFVSLKSTDGFGDDDPNLKEDYVVWQGEAGASRSSILYLHGALHLFDFATQLRKFTWIRTDERLKKQSSDAIEAGSLPLFVSEGTSEAKFKKINHSAYLYQAYRTLLNAATQKKASFFIHGHSLDPNDEHIFRALERGIFPDLFVSLHGDPTNVSNTEIIKRCRNIEAARRSKNLDIHFYSADSACVWRVPA